MSTMTGGRAVARALLNEGIRVVFGIPGVHNIDLYEGIREEPELRHVLTRHEQGAGFMADGYARATGQVGALVTITGPGATNAITPLGQAYSDHSPVLIVASEVDSFGIGRERGELHEMRDQFGTMSGVTCWSRRAHCVDEIPWAVHEAMQYLRNRSPRPAYLEIPKDVLAATGAPEFSGRDEVARPKADPELVARAASLLLGAERPILHFGRGAVVSGVTSEAVELAEALNAPVFTTGLGKGVIPADHPLHVGLTSWRVADWQAELFQQADLVLVVGTRLGPVSTAYGKLGRPQRVIQIDLMETQIGRNWPAEIGLVGDARDTLVQLVSAIEGRGRSTSPAWTRRAQDHYRSQCTAWQDGARTQLEAIQSLRSALPDEAIVTNDMTVFCYWMMRHFIVSEPRSFLFPFHFGSLGFALPAAIGAKFGCPDRKVLAICGDGGFMFTGQELATAVKHDLDLTLLLFNDNCYSSVGRHQAGRFSRPPFEVDVFNPDFMLLAQAYGVKGVRLGSICEVGEAVRRAIHASGVTLIECPIDLPLPT